MKLIITYLLLMTFSCKQNKPAEKTEVSTTNTETEINTVAKVALEIVGSHEGPVLTEGDAGTEGIKHGLEGGTVKKIDGVYHLFTSEQMTSPKWVKMRLGHWKSTNGVDWERLSTLKESSGNYTGEDTRAALWSPMPTFNERDNTWYLTYVAYRSKPIKNNAFYTNYDGRIWLAKSEVKGKDGFGGPYEDIEVILDSEDAMDWEGLQGTDSFFPYKVDGKWYGFHGSAQTHDIMAGAFWGVGLAQADQITGPWKRMEEYAPVDFKAGFAENPIVTKLDNGYYVAIVDNDLTGFSYSYSTDGKNWSKAFALDMEAQMKKWWIEVRTPLSLIKEDDGTYTVFYSATVKYTDYWERLDDETAELDTGFDSIGKLSVAIEISE